jgi:phosphoserine aminotransferase
MSRAFNFSAGPAALPQEVLEQAAREMLNWPDAQGKPSGMGVMEMSHRGKHFISIYEQAHANLKQVLSVPDHFKILFMQGGGIGQNAIVPLNLSRGGLVDVVVTGSWSQKSRAEAAKYAQVHVAASDEAVGFHSIPELGSWQLSPRASYVHICSNETINGVEFQELPDLPALGSKAPLVVDFSSHAGSRPVDWSRVGLAFAGAQKNLGPAGLTLVVVREDLLGQALAICPGAFNYELVARHDSGFNTPPTFAIYVMGLVLRWLQRQGGVAAMERTNKAKAQLLYSAIDASSLYINPVHSDCRSRMNVPFFLRQSSLDQAFLAGADERGLLQLKGHKSVGGMRASIYNAMPMEGVVALVAYMREFEQANG